MLVCAVAIQQFVNNHCLQRMSVVYHLCRQKLDSHLFLVVDSKREESVNSESLNISFGEVFVKFSQMKNSQHDAEKIDQDPDSIENVMSVRTLSSSEWLN